VKIKRVAADIELGAINLLTISLGRRHIVGVATELHGDCKLR